MVHVDRTMNNCALLRIPSTFPPIGAPCPATAMRAIARKLAALCSSCLHNAFTWALGDVRCRDFINGKISSESDQRNVGY